MVFKKVIRPVAIAMTTLLIPTMALAQGYGKVDVETLNVRKETATNASILTQLNKNDEVKILDSIIDNKGEAWLKIELEDNREAYVFAEYVSIVEVEGIVVEQDTPLRVYPGVEESAIITTLDEEEIVIVEYAVEDWYKVNTSSREGFLHSDDLDVTFKKELPTKEIEETGYTKTDVTDEEAHEDEEEIIEEEIEEVEAEEEIIEEEESTVSLGQTIIADALQFLGNRYVYGGNSLTNGVDCSGFTQQMMKRHGISISRTSSSQYASDGYKVSKSDLQVGDLLFYGYSGYVSHVAIYMGDGQVIHANTSNTGIVIGDAFSVGKPYIGAKRVL